MCRWCFGGSRVVLLTGPARGYVRRGLERRGIPYRHMLFESLDELAPAYHALDLYLVTSRQEGGPKGVLEAMASGVPVVTTRVGQAQELVEDGRNGLLTNVDHLAALAEAVLRIRDDTSLRAPRARDFDGGDPTSTHSVDWHLEELDGYAALR